VVLSLYLNNMHLTTNLYNQHFGDGNSGFTVIDCVNSFIFSVSFKNI
jgi:hypothetical protein